MRLLNPSGLGRLIFPSVVASVFLLVPSLLSFSASPRSDAWPQFRGNRQLTGVSSAVLPKTLRLLWSYETGDSIESSAAILEGIVFVGSQSGDLLAINLETGSLRWKYSTQDGIGESSPSVGNGVVYVGDLLGTLHAVQAADGTGLWTFQTESEIKSSPILVDDRVLIGSYDEHLYCLSARTGDLIWKFRTQGPVHCTAGVSQGIAYIAGCDEFFRAVRISDGKEIFNVASGSYTAASPAVLKQRAYFGTFSNEVISIDLESRRVAWRYEHPELRFPFYSSAVVADGKVIVGGRDKKVHCLNAGTGKPVWTFSTRGRVESSPAVAGDRVYVGSNDGRFYVLDLASGSKLWEFNAGAPISASPAISGGRIVIGSQDGQLYCFG